MSNLTKLDPVNLFIALAVLFVIMSIPYLPAREVAREYFTQEEIDTGLQYAFERRFFFWASTILELSLLCIFALTGLGRRCADRFLTWSGNNRVLAALGMGLAYQVTHEILYLPIGIGRLFHAQYWGMSNLDLPSWLGEHFLSFGIDLPWEVVCLAGLYVLLIGFPRTWWLLAAAGGSLLGVAYIYLSPLIIAPLFNDFTPLSETEWSHQQSRVQALCAKANVPVEEILVMNASKQSNHANAYFTGFGSSRRVVLYDTLLKKNYTDAEIESILAHELGHWQHNHIVKGLLLGLCAATLGLFLLDRLLRRAVGHAPGQLRSVADPAGAPLIFLLMYLGSWAAMPVGNAVSRSFERQADQASLDLAGQPEAFIRCEINLARDNKANVAPAPWNVWLFSTHPPTIQRIRMAEDWKAGHAGKSTR